MAKVLLPLALANGIRLEQKDVGFIGLASTITSNLGLLAF